ncbi:DUF2892 domain-containing protein [Parabacteroides sp. FAFU027]|uniref:YgaP family membrane protein n=1 Tax=Parabacteroides sp. FAFU027 TaxID=2922715 RepID=UPI001FAF00EA|nr:DUF2892 domain-containing protein [Parabacteroides sp. FAFU027]
MKKNMGLTDRVIRLIAAVVIVVLQQAAIIEGTLAMVLLVIAAVFVLTSVISWCPLYVPFKISTCKKSENKS